MKTYPIYEAHKDVNLQAHVDVSYPVVFYHKNCIDGIAAAYIMWKHMKGMVLLCEFEYNMKLPNWGNRPYIFVDCCPSVEQLDWIEECTAVPYVQVYDHHKDQVQTLQEHIAKCGRFMREGFYVEIEYQENLSGAGIVWKACNPRDFTPDWVIAVSESDLWHKDHPGVAEFGAFASKLPLDIRGWSVVDDLLYETMIALGGQYLRSEQKRIEALAATADLLHLMEDSPQCYWVAFVCAERDIRSVLADYIIHNRKCDLVCVYQHNALEWRYTFSFRSAEDATFTAEDAAKYFGGGGHRNAAGAAVSEEEEATVRKMLEHLGEYIENKIAEPNTPERRYAPE